MLCELEAAAEANFELKPSSLGLNEESAQTKSLKKHLTILDFVLLLFFFFAQSAGFYCFKGRCLNAAGEEATWLYQEAW